MAYEVKNDRTPYRGASVLAQYLQVSRNRLVLPQSTTEILFRVYGGRILLYGIIGEVTTVLTATDPIAKVSAKRLNDASVAIGSAVDIGTTVNAASLEVGGTLFVEGDGSALVKANAGNTLMGSNLGFCIVPQGEIYLTTGASNTTGAMKWDLWYQPLDAGAYVVPVDSATAAI